MGNRGGIMKQNNEELFWINLSKELKSCRSDVDIVKLFSKYGLLVKSGYGQLNKRGLL